MILKFAVHSAQICAIIIMDEYMELFNNNMAVMIRLFCDFGGVT